MQVQYKSLEYYYCNYYHYSTTMASNTTILRRANPPASHRTINATFTICINCECTRLYDIIDNDNSASSPRKKGSPVTVLPSVCYACISDEINNSPKELLTQWTAEQKITVRYRSIDILQRLKTTRACHIILKSENEIAANNEPISDLSDIKWLDFNALSDFCDIYNTIEDVICCNKHKLHLL